MSSADILNARILIVDDKDANVRLLQGMLHAAGYASIQFTTDPNAVCDLHRRPASRAHPTRHNTQNTTFGFS